MCSTDARQSLNGAHAAMHVDLQLVRWPPCTRFSISHVSHCLGKHHLHTGRSRMLGSQSLTGAGKLAGSSQLPTAHYHAAPVRTHRASGSSTSVRSAAAGEEFLTFHSSLGALQGQRSDAAAPPFQGHNTIAVKETRSLCRDQAPRPIAMAKIGAVPRVAACCGMNLNSGRRTTERAGQG